MPEDGHTGDRFIIKAMGKRSLIPTTDSMKEDDDGNAGRRRLHWRRSSNAAAEAGDVKKDEYGNRMKARPHHHGGWAASELPSQMPCRPVHGRRSLPTCRRPGRRRGSRGPALYETRRDLPATAGPSCSQRTARHEGSCRPAVAQKGGYELPWRYNHGLKIMEQMNHREKNCCMMIMTPPKPNGLYSDVERRRINCV